MKNVKFIFWVLISVIVLFPLYTSAESIINNNGIEISEEDYNNFLKIHTHEYIMTMTDREYERLKSFNYNDENITTSEKYFTTAYNQHLNLTTEREITEEEFENFNSIMPILESDGDYIESTAKKLTLALLGGQTYNAVTLGATWKGIPSTRSFDVIGIRGYGFNFRNGSQTGKQIYTLETGEYKMIDYSWNGTNIKRFDNGFGISMNVVNSDIVTLQFSVDCDVTPTIAHPTLYGSYQHAVKSTTLEQSQNYTLGIAGLGDVFVYPYSISQHYDGMTGTRIQY